MEADGELTGFLLEKGADPDLRDRHDWTALMWASFNGQRDLAMKLIKGRAALDLACKSGFPTQGWTALFFASATGRAEIVQELLANGANANVRESFGRTALMTAAAHGFTVGSEKGYCRVVYTGALNHLMLAPCDGFVKVARLLVAKGADVTPRDRNGHDALNYARQSGDHPIVALLEKRP